MVLATLPFWKVSPSRAPAQPAFLWRRLNFLFLYRINIIFSLNSFNTVPALIQRAVFFVAPVEKIAHNPRAACKSFPINTLNSAKVYVLNKDVKQKVLEAPLHLPLKLLM